MTAYTVNSAQYIFEKFDDNYILLNQTNGMYFECADNAARVLDLIMAEVDFDELATGLAERLDVLGQGALDTFAKLVSCQALEPLDKAGRKPTAEDIAVFEEVQEFIVQGHDDLAAFILADPVHEFDADGNAVLDVASIS